MSGHFVLYLPDGDRLRKHGFYVTPCDHRKGLYNLPEIAKEFCQQLLTSHLDDINAMAPVSREEMKEYLSDDQITRVFKRAYREDDAVSEEEERHEKCCANVRGGSSHICASAASIASAIRSWQSYSSSTAGRSVGSSSSG